eukprot:TRINITY_DN20903_c0_g1_i1.p1 TRINITY_DN20903_c0_g1~~TRINITY_DN20903_c0_g1_i1.p1  ORF type:complete len:975 (+),score=134.36 TRINITY_DN20903_c0_g1_i1:47-2971(+)
MTTLDLSGDPNGVRQTFPIVILGGGVAAGYFASEYVRQFESGSDLCIVSAESVCPYERPFLSKGFLTGKKLRDNFTVAAEGEVHCPDWYASVKIKMLLGHECQKVDISKKTLHIVDKGGMHSTIQWSDSLIIATGAEAAKLDVPGVDLPGIYHLRGYAHAIGIRDRISQLPANNKTAVVVGGGYIGMEVAASLSVCGLRVTMVFPAQVLLPRLFTKEISQFYEKKFAEQGVTILKNTSVVRFDQDPNTNEIIVNCCNKTTIRCGIVVCGVGSSPRQQLFEGQLDIDRDLGGVKVNKNLSTSIKGVYAIGDVASIQVPTTPPQNIRCEHVLHSRGMAKYLASWISSKTTQPGYGYFPELYSRCFNMSWRFWGVSSAELCSVEVKSNNNELLAVWMRGMRIVGAFLEAKGDTVKEDIVRNAVKAQIRISSEDITEAHSIDQLLTDVFEVRTEKQLTAENAARLGVPMLQKQLEQARLKVQQSQLQALKLQTELSKALEDRHLRQQSQLWGGDMVFNEFGGEREDRMILERVPSAGSSASSSSSTRAPLSLLVMFLATLANTFSLVGSSWTLYRELFELSPFPYFTNFLNAVIGIITSLFILALMSLASCYLGDRPRTDTLKLVGSHLKLSALRTTDGKKGTLVFLGLLFSMVNIMQIATINALGPMNSNITTLLAQFTTPLTSIATYLFMKNSYSILQVMGCSLIVSGVVIFAGNVPCGITMTSLILWILCYLLASVLQSVQNIVTTSLFSNGKVTLADLVKLLLLLNVVSIFFSPLYTAAFGSVATAGGINKISDQVSDGMQCFLLPNSTLTDLEEDDFWYPSRCHRAWIWVILFNVSSVANLLINSLVVMLAGPTCQFIATVLALPLLNATLASGYLMNGAAGEFHPLLWVSIALISSGMFLHEQYLFAWRDRDSTRLDQNSLQSLNSIRRSQSLANQQSWSPSASLLNPQPSRASGLTNINTNDFEEPSQNLI